MPEKKAGWYAVLEDPQQIAENAATSGVPALTAGERARAMAIAARIGTPNWSREETMSRPHLTPAVR
jgi:hypothetical protein